MDLNKPYLGRGWSFPPSFDEHTYALQMSQEEQDIRESLYILLTTTPGERPTRPDYGCDLHSVIFEPMNAATKNRINSLIKHAVLYFEPRIELDAVDIDIVDEGEGIVNLTLHYTVTQINSRANVVFPFYKAEGTIITDM
ncbi:MAG: GPW/gp25 family protein [Bacteroidota bacterium]